MTGMRLSMLVCPVSDENLALAAQVGVEDLVVSYPGLELGVLLEMKRRVEGFGLRLTHVERKVPHLRMVHRLPGWEEELAGFKTLLRNMGEAGMEVLCYNWMPDEDWQRTRCDVPSRGGSKVTAFDRSEAGERSNVTDAAGRPGSATPAGVLWENLERFLAEVVPVAEQAGVKLALHPDDPPLASLGGQERIIVSVEALERAVGLVPSEANGVCYCTGSLGVFGQQVVTGGIGRLAGKIVFAHVRNVRGVVEKFEETWHDDGGLDLVAVVRALAASGFSGTVRPDHAPSMAGESNGTPGYEMRGRLFAAGYLRGLMQASGCV